MKIAIKIALLLPVIVVVTLWKTLGTITDMNRKCELCGGELIPVKRHGENRKLCIECEALQ